MVTHMPYVITQCYLPPDRGDIPTFTPAKAGTLFGDLGGLQGWVERGTAGKLCSPCPRLHITVAFAMNTTARGAIRTWVLSHRSWKR